MSLPELQAILANIEERPRMVRKAILNPAVELSPTEREFALADYLIVQRVYPEGLSILDELIEDTQTPLELRILSAKRVSNIYADLENQSLSEKYLKKSDALRCEFQRDTAQFSVTNMHAEEVVQTEPINPQSYGNEDSTPKKSKSIPELLAEAARDRELALEQSRNPPNIEIQLTEPIEYEVVEADDEVDELFASVDVEPEQDNIGELFAPIGPKMNAPQKIYRRVPVSGPQSIQPEVPARSLDSVVNSPQISQPISFQNPQRYQPQAPARALESVVSNLSGAQKHLVAAYVMFGRSPYTKEGGILLLDDEINNCVRIEGIKQVDIKFGAYKMSVQAKNPEVIVTPYRIAAIGRVSFSRGKGAIMASAIAAAADMKRALSVWFVFDPEAEVFMRGEFMKREYGYTSYDVQPPTTNSRMFGESVLVVQRLKNLKGKAKNNTYDFMLRRGVNADQFLETVRYFQELNPRTITLSRAYDYFTGAAKTAKTLDKYKDKEKPPAVYKLF